jgi:uncharacterized protein
VSASAIYEGWVTHSRRDPVGHSFRYRVLLPYFDLEELPELLDSIPLWSARRPAPARFRSDDFLGGRSPSLSERARQLCLDRVGCRPAGTVRLLANPRYLGVGFNPVSFLFLHDRGTESVRAVIAEVTNTPWGERATYVLDGRERTGSGRIRGVFEKRMHVSPFQPMAQRYELTVAEPGERLRISIRSLEREREAFVATMSLRRSELSRASMLRLLLGHPPMTLATLARIYGQALRLRAKGAPVHPHPAEGRGPETLIPVPADQ